MAARKAHAARKRRTPKASPTHAARLRALRRLLAQAGASHMIVSDPVDVAYITGFLGGDSELLVTPAGKPALVSDFRYAEELEPFRGLVRTVMRRASMNDAIAELLAKERDKDALESVAIQADRVSLSRLDALKASLKKARVPVGSIHPVSGLVSGMRRFKDAEEVKLVSRAIRIQEDALEATLPQIATGMTELEICAILEYEMKARGSTQPGFTTIVAAQANGSLPHYRPADVKLTRGSPLLIDWGAQHAGYHGDMTRTFCFGRWPRELKEVYRIVLDAHQLAAAAIRPGKTTREIDAIARDHIASHGYGDRFGHSLGHGLGLRVHEAPGLSHMTEPVELAPGDLVTVEPGVYLPGLGGVRIEDDYLVTPRGVKNLSSLPKDLAWASR